jgi:hypothetical protein
VTVHSDYLAFLDRKSQLGGDFGFEPHFMPGFLFDFQSYLVDWAVRKGRAALFADCGMGKTPMQLVWAQNVVERENAAAPAKNGQNEAGNSAGQVAIRKIVMALYPTARASSGGPDFAKSTRSNTGMALPAVVIALWSTLRASDGAKGGPNMSFGAGGSPLPSQVSMAANTSNAPMENGAGSLHPEFAGWELGYPPAWLSCAPSAMPSTRARRQSSSAPTSIAGHREAAE